MQVSFDVDAISTKLKVHLGFKMLRVFFQTSKYSILNSFVTSERQQCVRHIGELLGNNTFLNIYISHFRSSNDGAK